MQRSVVGRERETREGEAQFTHMVLVSGLPLRTMWSGRNFTFHSLRAFLRHFCPPLKRSLSVISYMDHTHCATEIYIKKQQWKIGMVTNGGR